MKEATSSYKSINTILEYFGYAHEDYWHIDYKIFSDFSGFNYFWDVRKKFTDFSGVRDPGNIPLYLGADGEYYYSAIFLGHYALGAYQSHLLSSDESARKEFINVADWFVNNYEDYLECPGVWINKYPMKTFNLYKDWPSCLGQAKGISVLCRAYDITKDEKYLSAALEAMQAYFVNKDKGGVRVFLEDDFFWEEYPTINDSIVLNGHIFAIWSLYDLIQVLEFKKEYVNEYAKILEAYLQSLNILKRNYLRWDVKYWTKYDVWEDHYNVSSLFYHKLHIKQFKILALISKDDFFNDVSERWKMQYKNVFYRFYSLTRKIMFRF